MIGLKIQLMTFEWDGFNYFWNNNFVNLKGTKIMRNIMMVFCILKKTCLSLPLFI